MGKLHYQTIHRILNQHGSKVKIRNLFWRPGVFATDITPMVDGTKTFELRVVYPEKIEMEIVRSAKREWEVIE